MTTGAQGDEGEAPVPALPKVRAEPVPAGDSFFERLAEPLPEVIVKKETVPEGFERRGEPPNVREARRLRELLPPGYEPESAAAMTFDPRIAYALALGLSTPSDVFRKYGVGLEEARRLIALPAFISTIKRYKEEVTEKGVTFRLKAKIQAEDLLTQSYALATDPEVPAAVRADIIKWTAKMAGLEPTEKEKGGGSGAGSGFNLSITFAGTPAQPAGAIIDITPRVEGNT
jgi:hypothetical protein